MILRKQPGCWLRSSHSFKECVIAHWSSEVARKITGAKLCTEIADCSVFNNMHKKLKVSNKKRVEQGKRTKIDEMIRRYIEEIFEKFDEDNTKFIV